MLSQYERSLNVADFILFYHKILALYSCEKKMLQIWLNKVKSFSYIANYCNQGWAEDPYLCGHTFIRSEKQLHLLLEHLHRSKHMSEQFRKFLSHMALGHYTVWVKGIAGSLKGQKNIGFLNYRVKGWYTHWRPTATLPAFKPLTTAIAAAALPVVSGPKRLKNRFRWSRSQVSQPAFCIELAEEDEFCVSKFQGMSLPH